MTHREDLGPNERLIEMPNPVLDAFPLHTAGVFSTLNALFCGRSIRFPPAKADSLLSETQLSSADPPSKLAPGKSTPSGMRCP
jgi:hypothetical protein